ncbi:MAG: hypothetical protein TREMPRED_000347 [Tremellales sp. Tagirdzhanova-0007]|nr:MAG: hypothetical protein TREMPRED_000347 [Tremellales sp. Tagirdzhanova-0007]
MVKSTDEVVSDFNEIVNMTADELDAFLKTESSNTTGLSKEDGSGESIGHESGRKIVDILRRNPEKEPSKYTEEDKEHMRRVVSYCKRHLAQEGKLKETKGPEELEKSKSTRSLKNWGHDPMKTLEGGETPGSKKTEKPASRKAEKAGAELATKPASKSASKPASKEVEEPVSKKADESASKVKPVSKKTEKTDKKSAEADKTAKPVSSKAGTKAKADVEVGEKRVPDEESGNEPVPKKTKWVGAWYMSDEGLRDGSRVTKPVSEGSRKAPSRAAKKA